MKVYIRYTVYDWPGDPGYDAEVAFRTQVLGPNHWSGIGCAGLKRDICLYVTEEQAILFKLRFPGTIIDKGVRDMHNA